MRALLNIGQSLFFKKAVRVQAFAVRKQVNTQSKEEKEIDKKIDI